MQLTQTLKELKLEGQLVMASHSKPVFEGHVGGIPSRFPLCTTGTYFYMFK